MVIDGRASNLIAGRYRLGELLGSGGSASVFAATDESSATPVALKLLHPHLSEDAEARESLLREARAAAGLRHPNLVSVLDSGVHGVGVHDADVGVWIALELAPGITLAEYVERTGPMDIGRALAVTTGVLRGLEAAHAAGLVHRDVSPSNIVVAASEHADLSPESVRLVDFGLVDVASRPNPGRSDATAATVVGNANYISPEQAVGDAVDGRGDLYQVGGVLYFMLTGRPPYPRATAEATMQAHVSSPPPVASVLRPGVSREVDRFVVKCMLKRPDDRFASATEMLAAVAALGAPAPADSRTLRLPAAGAVYTTVRVERRRSTPPGGRTVGRLDRPPPDQQAQDRSADQPTEARSAGNDTSWAWRLGIALVVVGALIAWIVSSATHVPPPLAEPPATIVEVPPAAAPVQQKPAATTAVVVPPIVGGSLADARAALEAAGLAVGTVSETASAAAAWSVSGSVPQPGASVDAGSTVDLVVASGRNVIPFVAGLPRDAAIAAIQSAGFGVFLTVTADPSIERGTVLSTSPVGGSELGVGQPVTITVASSPAPSESPTPTPTSTGDPRAGDGR